MFTKHAKKRHSFRTLRAIHDASREMIIGPELPSSTALAKRKRDEEEQQKQRPDFTRLAAKYDYFARHARTTTTTTTTTRGECENDATRGRATKRTRKTFIDFTSWQATHDLCRALLEEIGVKNWSIPEGHLVPGFTQRRNYCEWVESLLEKDGVRIEDENVRGVDVGTGASAIFALLFTARHPKWDMFGTDITKEAVENARRNCLAAGAVECSRDETTEQVDALDKSRRRISIREVAKRRSGVARREEGEDEDEDKDEPPILDLDLFQEERVDFTVCNPPFFNTMSESSQNPRTNFGGTAKENSCRGGELSFVRRMILESRRVVARNAPAPPPPQKTTAETKKRSAVCAAVCADDSSVRWFTTMVGSKATLKMAKKTLREMKDVQKIRETAFVQGRTRRWGLAWSFRKANNNKAFVSSITSI